MVHTENTIKAFNLGRLFFTFKGSDKALVDKLSKLFPLRTCRADEAVELDLDNPDSIGDNPRNFYHADNGFEMVRVVVQRGLDHHLGALWFDAAALVSPDEVLTLITGASFAGKSTSAMALAIGHNWKIIDEDIALFDVTRDEIVTFASPVSIRPGTIKRVVESTGATLPLIYDEQWLPTGDLSPDKHYPAKVKLAINFSVVNPEAETPLVVQKLSNSEYIRQVLPISNALRTVEGITKLNEYLFQAECFRFVGGSLSERLAKMDELAKSIAQKSA